MSNILVITDNIRLASKLHSLIGTKTFKEYVFSFKCSSGSESGMNQALEFEIEPICIKEQYEELIGQYDLIISLHCKQLFPPDLIKQVRCVNVHPGLNPHNRGWFPQVFSIINGLPIGATIHEIDEELDHGKIIAQKETTIRSWETSIDVYNRVLKIEMELLKENLQLIIEGRYNSIEPKEEGNLNLKKDFNELCKLNLNENLSLGEAINKLRALTHGSYKNAYFLDAVTGDRIYVSIELERKPNE